MSGETDDNDEAIARLGRATASAIAAEDFEESARLRAEIDRLAGVDPLSRRHGRIGRGRLGAMGLGTDQASMRRPPGWRPPPKPDLMTHVKPRRDPPKGR